MLKFILKRLGISVVTLVAMYTIVFFLMHAVPGDPFATEGRTSQQSVEQMNEKYGLDKPLYQQYFIYGKQIVTKGDFGMSLKKQSQSVNDIIERAFPVSLRLGLVAISIAVTFGTFLGIVGALKRNTGIDRLVMTISSIGISVPSFVVATVGIVLFCVTWKILPVLGFDTWQRYLLPSFALAFMPLAFIARLTRSTMLDVLNQDYIRTARAKGLSEAKIVFKHSLRNAILPTITYMGPLLAAEVTGSFVIEKIFALPGLGRYFVDSITSRDYTVIMGTSIFFGIILISMNFFVDVIYVLVDPRIRLED